jgi:hypothetical protein
MSKKIFNKYADPIYSDDDSELSESSGDDGIEKPIKKTSSWKKFTSSESESEDEAPKKKTGKKSSCSKSKSKTKKEEAVHPPSVLEFLKTCNNGPVNISSIDYIGHVIQQFSDYIEDNCKLSEATKKFKIIPKRYILTSDVAKALGRSTGDKITLFEVGDILDKMYEDIASKKVDKSSPVLILPPVFLKMLECIYVSKTAIKTVDDAVVNLEKFVDYCLHVEGKTGMDVIEDDMVCELFGLPPKKKVLISTLAPMLRALYEKLNKVVPAEEIAKPE